MTLALFNNASEPCCDGIRAEQKGWLLCFELTEQG